jgi:hypothetical protein
MNQLLLGLSCSAVLEIEYQHCTQKTQKKRNTNCIHTRVDGFPRKKMCRQKLSDEYTHMVYHPIGHFYTVSKQHSLLDESLHSSQCVPEPNLYNEYIALKMFMEMQGLWKYFLIVTSTRLYYFNCHNIYLTEIA